MGSSGNIVEIAENENGSFLRFRLNNEDMATVAKYHAKKDEEREELMQWFREEKAKYRKIFQGVFLVLALILLLIVFLNLARKRLATWKKNRKLKNNQSDLERNNTLVPNFPLQRTQRHEDRIVF
jgi:flagellar biosynthesis/type III secretory pathway M-ring protein FliF/YscJ